MTTFSLENMRTKPHHVRRQIAFGLAAGISAIIGIVWIGESLTSGSFALKDSPFAIGAGTIEVPSMPSSASGSSLLASPSAATAKSSEGSIQIVDAPPSEPASPEPTVLPF